jgi:hypothetical protein
MPHALDIDGILAGDDVFGIHGSASLAFVPDLLVMRNRAEQIPERDNFLISGSFYNTREKIATG